MGAFPIPPLDPNDPRFKLQLGSTPGFGSAFGQASPLRLLSGGLTANPSALTPTPQIALPAARAPLSLLASGGTPAAASSPSGQSPHPYVRGFSNLTQAMGDELSRVDGVGMSFGSPAASTDSSSSATPSLVRLKPVPQLLAPGAGLDRTTPALRAMAANVTAAPPAGLIASLPPTGLAGMAAIPDLSAMGVPSMPSASVDPADPGGRLLKDQTRLSYLQRSGAGVDQIAHPVDAQGNPTNEPVGFGRKLLSVLGHTGDIALSAAAPGIAALAPGTTLHHNMLLGQTQNRIGEDEGELQKGAALQQSQAQTALTTAEPQLKQGALDLQQSKLDAQIQHNQDMNDYHNLQVGQHLAASGFKRDETGKIVPLEYNEMSEQQQAIHDLKGTQAELADAQKAYKDAQTKNMPLQMQMAQARIQTAQRNSSIAEQRLGLSRDVFNAGNYGIGPDGQPLPGSLLTADGTPVGSRNAANVRPTGVERTKGDLAQSALDRVHEMQSLIQRRPDIFGPGAGRLTNAKQWLGSSDPDAATYQAASQYLADHSAGVFGGRGQYIMSQLHGLTDPKFNPSALQATLSEAERAAQGFAAAGTMHTASGPGVSRLGGKAGSGGNTPPPPPPPPDGMVMVQLPNGQAGPVHPSQVQRFLQDHPGAKQVNNGR